MLEMIDTTESTGPIGPTDWMEGAACNGKSNLFFAPFAERPEARVRREASARKVCESCDSLQICQTYARTNRELGFWGASLRVNGLMPALRRPPRSSAASALPRNGPARHSPTRSEPVSPRTNSPSLV